MSFQTLLFTLFCPSFPYFPMVFQPQVHPLCFILDQCDFFLPHIHPRLGPQPVDPVNLKCLVNRTRHEPDSSLTLIHPLISLLIIHCPYAPKPCQSIIPLPQPLLFNHISTEGQILRADGPILVHDLIASFKVLQSSPGPLICPLVSGNFVFSPPNVPSSHSVLPIAPSIPPLSGVSVHITPLEAEPSLWFETTKFYVPRPA